MLNPTKPCKKPLTLQKKAFIRHLFFVQNKLMCNKTHTFFYPAIYLLLLNRNILGSRFIGIQDVHDLS